MEKLALKNKLYNLVRKYDTFAKTSTINSQIYNEMKTDLLDVIAICITRNKF